MSSVDNRVVKMSFDNAEFEKKAGTTLTTLDKLKKSLNFSGAAKGMEQIGNAANSISFGALADGVQALQDRFSVMGEFAHNVFSNMLDTAVNTGKKIADALVLTPMKEGFSEYEQQMNSVQTIMASAKTNEGLPVTLDLVNQKLDELNTYADKTIYSFSDMTQNIGKFTNAGVSLEDSVAAIQGISNEAAISGANTNEASRAMYNFAQALSAGYVKLIDWKSIETANMATVDFKQGLIDTAVAMGTVVKVGDQYQSTTTNAKGDVSELFDATTSFNDSLQAQWMTTDVLTQTLKNYSTDVRTMSKEERKAYREQLKSIGYTKEQIKGIEELGKKAFDAAQDVKTFSQLIDTLKEALGSGWTKTWQIVIGDFEESKKLWTDVNKVLSGFVDANANARNEMLQAWSDAGGRTALIDSLWNAFNALVSIMTPLKEAWDKVFPSVKADDLIKYTNNLRDFTAELKLNDDQAKNLKTIAEKVFKTFELGFTGIKNLGTAAFDVLGAIGRGIKETFKIEYIRPFTKLASQFKKFTEALQPSEKALEAIQRLAAGISTVFAALGTVFADIGAAIFNTLTTKLNEFKQNSDDFLDFIIEIGDKLKEFGEKINSSFNMSSFSGFDNIADSIAHFFNIVKDAVNLPDLIRSVLDYLLGIDFSGILNTVNGAAEGSSSAIDLIHNAISNFLSGGVIGKLVTKIKEFVSGINWKAISKIVSHIESFVATKSLLTLARSAKDLPDTLGDLIDKFKDISNTPVGAVTNLLNGVKDSLESWQKNLKALVLIEIGVALVAIATALKTVSEVDPSRVVSSLQLLGGGIAETVVLLKVLNKMNVKSLPNLWGIAQVMGQLAKLLAEVGKIEPDRVEPTIKALGVILGELAIALKVMDKTDINAEETIYTAAALWVLAEAVSMLANTLKKLGDLSPDQITRGLIAVGGLIAELVIALRAFPKGEAVTGALTVIAMAAAIRIIAKAVDDLGKLKPEQLAAGCAAVGYLLLVMTMSLNSMPDSGKLISSGAAMILMSIAISSLTGSLERLAAIKSTSLAKSLGAFAVVLGGLVIALNNLPDSGKLLSSGAAMIMMAIAIESLTGSLERLAAIKSTSLVKSLGAFAVMLGGLVVALNNLPDSGKLISSGIAMDLMAVAISSLTGSLERLAAIKSTSLAKSLGAFAVVLGGLVLALNNLPDSGKLISSGIAMGLMAISISSLTGSLERLSAIKSTSLAKSIIGLGVALLELSIAAQSFNDSLVGAAAMVVVAGAVAILAPALVMLSGIEIGGLVIALGALAGAMVIFGVAASALAPTVGVLVAFGAAVALAGIGLFALSAALGAIASIVAQTGTQISEAFGIILQAFIDNIPLVVELVTTMILSLLEALGTLAPAFFEFGLNIIVSFLTVIAEHIGEIVVAGVSIVVNFIKGVADSLGMIIDAAFYLIISFIEGLANAIDAHHNDLWNAVGHLIKSIVDAILDGLSKIGGAAKDLISNPGGFIDGLGGFATEIFNAGANLVQGFIDGIGSMATNLWNAACNLAQDAWNAITGTLDEHSPSRLTFGGGVNFVLGFINGMEDVRGDAISKAGSVAYGAMNAFETGLNSANTTFSPVYTPVIDSKEIQNGISGVVEMVDAIPSTYGITADIQSENALKKQLVDIMGSSNDYSDILDSINGLKNEISNYNNTLSRLQVVMDSGALVGAIAPDMDIALGYRAAMAERGVY